MSNAVAKQGGKPSLKQLLTSDSVKAQIANALPKHMTADRMSRVALTALLKTPKLANTTPESFMECLLTCSALGIEPDGRNAHLIPYKNTCTLIIDYKGLVALARRSGNVAAIHADVVCDNDDFEYDCGEVKKHRIDFKSPRGEMYAAYATVTMKDGTKQSEVMSKEDIEAIRNRSRSGSNGPWVSDYNEMAKKTAFRRLSKWLELSPEYRTALDVDDDPRLSADVIDAHVVSSGTQQLNNLLTEEPAAEDEGVAVAEKYRDHIMQAADGDTLTSIIEEIDRSHGEGVITDEVQAELYHAANQKQEEFS